MPGPLGEPGSGECPTPKYCQGHAGVQAVLRIFASSQGNVDDRDSVAPGRGFKCKQCTKVLKKIKALAGDDPDEVRDDEGLGVRLGGLSLWPPDLQWLWQEAVAAALQKGCRALGRTLGKPCQKFVNQFKDQITEGLQNGDMPRDICAAVGLCRS